MDRWINHLLMGCGSCAGLLLGTGRIVEGVSLALVAIGAVWQLRRQAKLAASEEC
ncbi:MAG: hypothetical protein ROZ37_00885 [Aromatoleum sp.]|uniref:hypothetical protein n=1 Tax=Aromatoleum sp. TaxID=2307007 RepID=UPI002894A885|nr:hypothetical protein [Aromatoleum sp.]MDT3668871.1 hypothetical protein [Aromatoleum sp.]